MYLKRKMDFKISVQQISSLLALLFNSSLVLNTVKINSPMQQRWEKQDWKRAMHAMARITYIQDPTSTCFLLTWKRIWPTRSVVNFILLTSEQAATRKKPSQGQGFPQQTQHVCQSYQHWGRPHTWSSQGWIPAKEAQFCRIFWKESAQTEKAWKH